MTTNVTGNRHGMPCIAWISVESRRRLDEICTGLNAVPERFCGALLEAAIEAHVRGQQRPATAAATDHPPAADRARQAASRSGLSASERAGLKAGFEGGTRRQ